MLFMQNIFRLLFISFLTVLCFVSCESEPEAPSLPESQQISNYIKTKNLKIQDSTATGLKISFLSRNPTGALGKVGSRVFLNYKGSLVNDKVFDSGSFDFALGVGQVVRGFDLGVAKMRVGEKAILIFPSELGYGSQKKEGIPAYSPLVFEIEITQIL
jgi:FKBP-type peptidyl-prolyl cis-trans isomerase